MTTEVHIPVFNRFLATLALPEKGEAVLWSDSDGEYTHTHLLDIGFVTKSDLLIFQIIFGPLHLSLATRIHEHSDRPPA